MKVEYCIKASAAVSIAKKCLPLLPHFQRRLLSKFNSVPQAALLNNVPIWVVSQYKTESHSEKSIILYVVVQTGVLCSDTIKDEALILFQDGAHFGKGAFDFHFTANAFNITTKQGILSREEAEKIWEKRKEKFMLSSSAERFIFLKQSLPAFCKQTPLYVIGYRRSSYSSDVKVLAVYALSRKLVCRTYQHENWQKMRNAKPGDYIKIANIRILIDQNGFEQENF